MRWCVAGFTAVLAGCVAGPNFVAPSAPAPSSYTVEALPSPGDGATTSGATTIDATLPEPDRWWAPLNSPRLDSAIRQALAASHSLEAARATLAEAQAVSDASEAGRYPHVDLDAGAGRR
jgi:outer membrane protein TolC